MGKLTGNGLWETSFIIPEHKRRILADTKEAKNPRRERPILDQQECDEISEAFIRSLNEGESVKIHFFDPYMTIILEGVVQEVDVTFKKIRIAGEWYPLKDVIGVG